MAGLGPRPRGLRGAGWDWERFAERELAAAGYRVLERNFRLRSGEIDFVAEDSGVLCFVEVKGRSGSGFGRPADAVTSEKQRRIFRAAQVYLRRRGLGDVPCRFDVVTIDESGDKPRVEILRDAFRGPFAPRKLR
jgi:putative endonuclease